MKLRVLACAYACRSVKLGGGEDLLGWSVVQQLGRFHQVWVLTHAENRRDIEAGLPKEGLPGVQLHYVSLPGWLEPLQHLQGGIQFYAYLWQVKAYFVARRLHRQFRFDVFHHVTYANDWMASFIGALLSVPFIRGPGGGAHRTPKAFLCEYSFRGRLAERIRAAGQWVLRNDPLFRLGQRRARAILVCNREALEAIPLKRRPKAYLFPVNGVPTGDFATSTAPPRQDGKFRVLSAGKLLRIKGLDLAIRAFKVFVERFPTKQPFEEAEFTVVGDGPELPRLEALIRRLDLGRRVYIKNWMPREKLIEEMTSCDVFLFPSLRDGGGAVVVEAMAAGKPVICLDLAGPGMHVTEECGIKIPPESPEQAVNDMATALERLYSDKELRFRMGKASRERAEQVYHWDRLGERLREIYAQAALFPHGCSL